MLVYIYTHKHTQSKVQSPIDIKTARWPADPSLPVINASNFQVSLRFLLFFFLFFLLLLFPEYFLFCNQKIPRLASSIQTDALKLEKSLNSQKIPRLASSIHITIISIRYVSCKAFHSL